MPLRKRVVEFPLGSGVDQSKYPIPLEGPVLASLTNGRIQKSGGVEPRRGYTSAATGSYQIRRLFGYRGALHALTHNTASTLNSPCLMYALNNGRLDLQGGSVSACTLPEATIYDRVPISRDALSEVDAASGSIEGIRSAEQKNPDHAYDAATNFIVIAWQQRREALSGAVGATHVYAEVRDATTMAIVSPARCISTGQNRGQNPRCINHNGFFYVVYDNGADADILVRGFDQTFRAWDSISTAIVTNLDTAFSTAIDGENTNRYIWDCCELRNSEDTCWYLIYRNSTPEVSIRRIAGTTITHSATIAEVPRVVGIDAMSGSAVWISWYVTSTTLLRFGSRLAADITQVTAATTAFNCTGLQDVNVIGVVAYDSTNALVTWSHNAATDERVRSGYISVPVGSSTACHRDGLTLVSKPLVVNSVVYANYLYDGNGSAWNLQTYFLGALSMQSSGFSTVFTVALAATDAADDGTDVTSWRVVAPWMYGVAGNRRDISTLANFRKVGNDPTDSARQGIFAFSCTQETATETVTMSTHNGTTYQLGANGIDFCRMQFDATDRFKAVEFGQNLVIAGGVTSVFDGARVSEYGFWWPPECSGVTESTGGLLSSGTYSWAATLEYRLATGDIVKSAPALLHNDTVTAAGPPVEYEGGTSMEVDANDSATMIVQHCTLTQKYDALGTVSTEQHASPRVTIYRTEANGDIFYLDSANADASTTFTLANNPFAMSGAALESDEADVTLIAKSQLYTTGGQLPNYPIPATDDLAVHRGRLWWIRSEDKRELGFTHQKEDGELPGTHPFLTLRIDDGGDCIGLATLDEKLVVFKRDSVYVVHGDGPDRRGVGSSFQITKVHTEHGCRDRRSIVGIPQGIMFASRRGLCLLSRGFQVQYIGGPVEDAESGKEYVSAVALADEEQVYFQIRSYDGTGGRILAYHWDSGAWSVDTVLASSSTKNPAAGAYVNGTYYAAFSNDLAVYSHTGYSDCGTDWIPLGITTPWLKVSGMQGFGRMWWASLVGERHSAHGLSISVYRDYASSAAQTVTFSESVVTASLANLYQPKVHIKEQVGQAYKLAIATTAPSGAHGRAAVWNGLAFEMGMKGGIRRQPDGRMEG